MQPPIMVEKRGTWHLLVLNRPERLNAFTTSMHDALRAALDDAAADPDCRAILITGAGRGFCAGQDLNDRVMAEESPIDLGETLEKYYNPLVRRLRAMPKPIVCAVNGVAAGAGANLALACDIVLAARSAKFIQSFARLGLVPDCGGTFSLPRLVGEARARGLAFLGDPLSAEQAAEWGLIWQVVDDNALRSTAEALTERLAAQPTQGVALTKRALAASLDNTLEAQLDLEAESQRAAGRTPDYREGVNAFLEKRPPVFTGKPA
jgi:2-(1,2-epoxy-1,2-dihydrophenyl)acetyl-CoA isomerase